MDKLLQRLIAKTEPTEDGCWRWIGSMDRKGYGSFRMGQKVVGAHRASMILHGYEIPPGMVIDHVCRNRACVNPGHLRIVSAVTNVMENTVAPPYLNSLKTHCPQGHAYAGDNLLVKPGRRGCRECHRVASLEAWHRKGKFARQQRTR